MLPGYQSLECSLCSLVGVLDVHLEQNGLPIIDKFADEFPDTITLGQTIAAWKFIVQYQEKQKE